MARTLLVLKFYNKILNQEASYPDIIVSGLPRSRCPAEWEAVKYFMYHIFYPSSRCVHTIGSY